MVTRLAQPSVVFNAMAAGRALSSGKGLPGGAVVKNPSVNTGDGSLIPGSGRALEEGMATHSRILAWKIPWKKEPGWLQSKRLQKKQTQLSDRTRVTL